MKGSCKRCGLDTSAPAIKFCTDCWLLLVRQGRWPQAAKEAGIPGY